MTAIIIVNNITSNNEGRSSSCRRRGPFVWKESGSSVDGSQVSPVSREGFRQMPVGWRAASPSIQNKLKNGLLSLEASGTSLSSLLFSLGFRGTPERKYEHLSLGGRQGQGSLICLLIPWKGQQ